MNRFSKMIMLPKDGSDSKEFESKPIPKNKRKSTINMIFMMLGFSIFSASIWVGGDLSTSFDFPLMLLVVLVGNGMLAIYIGLVSYIGGETGKSTHELSKGVFGNKGFSLSSAALVISQAGWFGVGIMMFVQPIMSGTNINANLEWLLIIGVGIAFTASAFFGVKALTAISWIAVPTVLIFGFIMMSWSIGETGGWDGFLNMPHDGDMSISTGIGLVFATFVSGGTIVSDFTRWSKSGKHAVVVSSIAFLIGNSLMIIFGYFSATAFGNPDIGEALMAMGLIAPGIIILGLNIWTTNDNALYATGLGTSSIIKTRKEFNVIVIGLIATFMAPVINNYFIPFLNILNLLLPGIGVLLFYQYVSKEDSVGKEWNWWSIASWASGFAIGWIIGHFAKNSILPLNVMGVTLATKILTDLFRTYYLKENYKTERINIKHEKNIHSRTSV